MTNNRQHYEIERELACRLRQAPPGLRKELYSEVYNELYRRVPDHPFNLETPNSPERRALTAAQFRGLRPYLSPGATVLEIGPGGGALALELSQYVANVCVVDISDAILADIEGSPNVTYFASDGSSVPVPMESVHVAISHQVIEHLHPDDAQEQLEEIYTALLPGGAFLCFTPNRLTGPYDVSRGYDAIATGMHLHEYTNLELVGRLRDVGFGRVRHLFKRAAGTCVCRLFWCAPSNVCWVSCQNKSGIGLRIACQAECGCLA